MKLTKVILRRKMNVNTLVGLKTYNNNFITSHLKLSF